MIFAVWLAAMTAPAQPPASLQTPSDSPSTAPRQVVPGQTQPNSSNPGVAVPNTAGTAPGAGGSPFSTGVFPFGATMAVVDPRGGVSIELILTETALETATRTEPVRGPEGQTQYRTVQITIPKVVYKTVRRQLPPDLKLYRSGREIPPEEKASLTQPTPIFIAMLGVPGSPPAQGYEKIVGDALVAFIPPAGIGTPATGVPPAAVSTPGGGGQVPAPAMAAPTPTAATEAQPAVSPMEKEVVDKANAARSAAGLPALKIDSTLMKAARQHSANMAKVGKLDHVLDGKGPQERLVDLGIKPTFTGENCAQGQLSGGDAFESWMSSPGHRGNILNPSFTHIGVGKADGADGPYWTQVFARL
jgi:uncharacterized protein YkwD